MTNTDSVGAGLSPTDIIAPDGPWSVRPAPQPRGRAAVEVYEGGELLDIVVESRLRLGVVRGARRAVRCGRWASFVWGRLPGDGRPPAVAFVGRLGRLGRRRRQARVVPVGGAFWFACAEGSFHGVLVQPAAGPAIRLRTERAG